MPQFDPIPRRVGRYRKKETPEGSPAGTIISVVILCGFLFFGISMFRLNGGPSPGFSGSPGVSTSPDVFFPDASGPSSDFERSRNLGQIFILFWCALVVLGIISALLRAAGSAPTTSEIIEIEDLNDAPAPSEATPASRTQNTAQRLRELESLRGENLISEAEYRAKRRELLDGL